MIADNLSKLTVYINPKLTVYWDKLTPCAIDSKPTDLGRYYMDFKCKFSYKDFDNNGVAIYTGQKYQPTVICQYAFGAYEFLYQSKFTNEKYLSAFLNQANWLVNNSVYINGVSGWKFDYNVNEYNLKAPWFSALSQGEALSVLVRAYQLTKDERFHETALAALDVFELPVEKGGIVNFIEENPVYEEYPSEKLNFAFAGFIFSLFGLFDFSLLKNEKAKRLFHSGIKTLKMALPKFDTGDWTQYSLYHAPEIYLASGKYHLLHIEQMKTLYYLTEDHFFLQYHQKWQEYNSTLKKRISALRKKIKSKI